MNLSARIKQYLDNHKVSYHVFCHPPTVTLGEAAEMLSVVPDNILRSVLLSDGKDYLLAILSLARKIDFALLKSVTRRDYKIVPRSVADRLFMDCEPGSHPPLGEAYNIPVLVDKDICHLREVYFEPGAHTCLVRMHQSEFHYLLADAPWERFSVPMANKDSVSSHWTRQPDLLVPLQLSIRPDLEAVGNSILSTYRIPQPNPSLYKLEGQSFEEKKVGLMSFLDTNPQVRALLMHYQIPCDKINEYQDDVSGNECLTRVLLIVLMVDVMFQFHFIQKGPISRDNLIKHSLLSALLFESIAKEHLKEVVDPNMCFAVAICQNLGLFLMGHLFPPEYQMLSKMVLFNPKTPVDILEKRLVGMGRAQQVIKKGHALVGAWLIAHWKIASDEVSVTIAEHHNLHFKGTVAMYTRLLIAINAQIKAATGLGDGAHHQTVEALMGCCEEEGLLVEQWCTQWMAEHQSLLEMPPVPANPVV